jgi:hypothetical protein
MHPPKRRQKETKIFYNVHKTTRRKRMPMQHAPAAEMQADQFFLGEEECRQREEMREEMR